MSELAVRPDPDELAREVSPVVAKANALAVRNVEEHKTALELLADVRRAKKLVKAKTHPIREATHAAWKKACEFAAEFLDPLDEADKTITRKAGAWDEQQRAAAEAEHKRLEAEALAEQERQRELDAAMADTELEQLAALTDPLPPPVVKVTPQVAQVAGVSGRGTWKAEITDKAAFARWVASTPNMLYLIEPNMPMLNSMAKNQHEELSIPGVKATCVRGYASR